MKKYFAFVAFALMLLAACAPPKKGKRPSLLSRGWHNMNTHYNGYYNAELRLDDAQLNLANSYQDNYQQILPMYKFTAVADAKSVSSQLDEAIKKCAVVVSIHRPSDWQDDSYLLLGKCEYTKMEYEKALQTFRYITIKYNPDKPLSQMSREERDAARKRNKLEMKQKVKDKKKVAKKKKRVAKKKKRHSKHRRKKKKTTKKPAYTKKGKTKNVNTGKTSQEVWSLTDTKADEAAAKEEKEADINPNDSSAAAKKKLKKTQKKKKNYFLRRHPAYFEAMLWEARTHIELKQYDQAERCLLKLTDNPDVPKRLRAEVELVRAYRFLEDKKYDKAIEPLERGISMIKRKKDKVRFEYILAQLYQQQDRAKDAANMFAVVLKHHADFDMDFNATMNSIIGQDGNSSRAVSKLNRMLKEEKNASNLDQIYFALAQIDEHDAMYSDAKMHYKKSVMKNTSRPTQKAEAYLSLAKMYDKEEDFVNAAHYYDSTLTVLNQKDERYASLSLRKNTLIDIAANLEIIALQDSLLHVADMSADDQKALAKRLKAQRLKDNSSVASSAIAGTVAPSASLETNSFVLYNNKLKEDGRRDFIKRWGGRPLTDNWRISKVKDGNEGNEANSSSPEEEATNSVVVTQKEIETLLADVPKTEAQRKSANDKIMEALFALGKLYRDKLNDVAKSTRTFRDLLSRYPDNPHTEETLFFLYLLAKDKGDSEATQTYKNQIVQKFPTGKIAKSLTDPTFLDETQTRELNLRKHYDLVYQQVQNRQYNEAFAKIAEADSIYGRKNTLTAKFDLLNAMCLGALKGKDAYVTALKTVKTSYPGTEEEKKAADLLKILIGAVEDKTPTKTPGSETPANTSQFTYKNETVHFIIVILTDKNSSMEAAKQKVTDYNTKNHAFDKLKSAAILLDKSTQSITIRKFTDGTKAQDYVREVKNKADFLDPAAFPNTIIAISQDNYNTVMKNNSLNDYIQFYQEKYK